MRHAFIAGLALVSMTPAVAAQPIAGRWLTAEGDAVVAIGPCGATLCGRIVRVLKTAVTPDAATRARQAAGVAVLTNLIPDGDGWTGQLHNPRTGKTYTARVTRDGAKLKVRGCVSIICRTIVWTAA